MYTIIQSVYHDHSNADSNASNNMKFGVKDFIDGIRAALNT